jgi:predicted RNA-binding protein with PIN domain
VLAAANRRWADEHGVASGHREELDRLRGELAELRTRLRGEPARTREVLAAAAAESAQEVAELRKTVRDRTRDLRQAERERVAALAEIDELHAQLATAAAAHEAELRRQRGRQAEAERSAETARRGARTERDIDDARLWLLIDTLVQAASGVRRELSLSPPRVRPADTVTAAEAAGGRRTAEDPASLDRLLALPNVHLIVDGYNVTKTGYGELPLEQQRNRLIGALASLAGQSGAEITIAFDGAKKPPVQPAVPRGVRVLFSAADEIADDLIRRLVGAEPPGRPLVVVTSDRQVVTDVGRAGAWTVPSAVLLARLG